MMYYNDKENVQFEAFFHGHVSSTPRPDRGQWESSSGHSACYYGSKMVEMEEVNII